MIGEKIFNFKNIFSVQIPGPFMENFKLTCVKLDLFNFISCDLGFGLK